MKTNQSSWFVFLKKEKSWYNSFRLRVIRIIYSISENLILKEFKMSQTTQMHIYIYIYNLIKKCKKYRLKPTENPVGFLRFLEVSNG